MLAMRSKGQCDCDSAISECGSAATNDNIIICLWEREGNHKTEGNHNISTIRGKELQP